MIRRETLEKAWYGDVFLTLGKKIISAVQLSLPLIAMNGECWVHFHSRRKHPFRDAVRFGTDSREYFEKIFISLTGFIIPHSRAIQMFT